MEKEKREKTHLKLTELFVLLEKIPKSERPSIILNIDKTLLFCYKEEFYLSMGLYGKNRLLKEEPNRGNVLNFFGVIELLVNQIFVKNFVQEGKDVMTKFEQLLDTIDLFTKVKLLHKWSIINSETKEMLICLKGARNDFAHNWNIKNVKYKNKSIFENYHDFENDADIVFNTLTTIFNGGNIDIDKLIEETKSKLA
ncbi:MAG: hypothetical protein KAR54_02350 [Candidatus Pacebacteria bacterium]|nr:hypothetical protein [Candidatus Paceibacterota bacterium]